MAMPLLNTYEPHQPAQGRLSELSVVETIAPDYEQSRQLLNDYLDKRDLAQQADKINGEELIKVQENVRRWAEQSGLLTLPDIPEDRFKYYTGFSEGMARSKILGLVDYLEKNHGHQVSPIELEASRAFVEACFSMYAAQPQEGVAPDADGSFAFVVPARMGRNHPDYGQEVEPTIPAFRYLPNELRAHMMIGLPPFIIDTYDQVGRAERGYLILAPVFEDMLADLGSSVTLLMNAGTHNINAAVDFAQKRLGVRTVGLGATLPALTNYGKTITNEHVTLTTGHGGTVKLINDIVRQSMQDRVPDAIGVLGLGAIGDAIARVLASAFPKTKLNIYDKKPSRIARVEAAGTAFVGCKDEKAVIESSDIVVSAITDRIDLKQIGIDTLDGKVIVDDSQPGSINPEQAEAMGGAVVWAIGSDPSAKVARRRGYDYATMVDQHTDLFGCEAEAASLEFYREDLKRRGMTSDVIDRILDKVAIHERVTVQKARYIGALFTRFGLGPSKPQAFGRPVNIPNS